jgi:hypothetical protein
VLLKKFFGGNPMRFWNRLVLSALVLALSLSLAVGMADAATSTKKKTTKKVEKKKEKKREEQRAAGPSKYIEGVNLAGRSGLFYGDTSETVGVGRFAIGAGLTFQAIGSGNALGIPFGGSFGVAKNLDFSIGGNLSLYNPPSPLPSSSAFAIDFGGKYHIATSKTGLDFSLGGDIMIPTNAGGQVVVTPRGTITYVLPSGLLLNGDLGIAISTLTYVTVDLGMALPVGDKLNLIAELGANQGGYLASQLALGLRYKVSPTFNLQGLVGVPLNGGSALVGAGLSIASM